MRARPLALMIDDDALFRKAFEAVLPRLGIDVKTTEEPAKFLELAGKVMPDLFLIDLQLNNATGFDLIAQLRANDPLAIIIVVSGAKGQDNVVNALELGANDFIMKPLDRILLASKLSRYVQTDLLNEHRAQSLDPPEGRAPGKLAFDVEVTEIDEIGIGFVTRHLIRKGTVIRLKTDFFAKIGCSLGEVLVTVASNSFDVQNGSYTAYAEFEEVIPELDEALKRWWSTNKKK